LEGSPTVSLGNVAGSNIVNITLVVGLTGLIVGAVHVNGSFFKRDVLIALVAALLPAFLLTDGVLSTVDGLILLAVYFAYATGLFRKRYEEIAKKQNPDAKLPYRFVRTINYLNGLESAKKKQLAKLFVGIAIMLFSADLIVRFATILAEMAGLDSFVIGLVIVAAGTSLPELAFSVRALRRRESSMFLGNILGSTIANSTLVLGVTSIIYPITVTDVSKYLISIVMFVVVFVTFWFFIKTKYKLEKWESSMLLVLYLIFLMFVLV